MINEDLRGLIIGVVGFCSSIFLIIFVLLYGSSAIQAKIYNDRYHTNYSAWEYMWVTPAPITITKESK